MKQKLKEHATVVFVGSIGILIGGCMALWLRQKTIEFLNKRALYGVDVMISPINQGNEVGISIFNRDTGERLGIGLSKESASRIANYIYQIIDGNIGEIEGVIEIGNLTTK